MLIQPVEQIPIKPTNVMSAFPPMPIMPVVNEPAKEIKKTSEKKAKPIPPKPTVFMPPKSHQTETRDPLNKANIPKTPSIPTRDSGGKLRESGGSKPIAQEENKANPFGNIAPPKEVPKPPMPIVQPQPYIPSNLGLNPNFGLSKSEKVVK